MFIASSGKVNVDNKSFGKDMERSNLGRSEGNVCEHSPKRQKIKLG
jgi:hypothetical protein